MAIAFHVCFKRVQVNQDGWKLTGTHQRLVYADAVIIRIGRKRAYYKGKDKNL